MNSTTQATQATQATQGQDLGLYFPKQNEITKYADGCIELNMANGKSIASYDKEAIISYISVNFSEYEANRLLREIQGGM